MTVSDLPVEGPRPWPGTSDHQFDSAGLTEAHRHCGAAVGVWTRSSRPPPGLSDEPSSARATETSRRAARAGRAQTP